MTRHVRVISASPARVLAATTATAALTALAPCAATAAETPPGAPALTQAVGRGDGSVDLEISLGRACRSTTEVKVALPEGSAVISVADPRGWTHDVRSSTVTWLPRPATAADLEADVEAVLLTARLAVTAGQEVLLPTTQRCADGSSTAWTDPDRDSATAAPRFLSDADTVDPSATAVTDPETSAQPATGWLVGGIVLAPVLAAGAVLVRARRHRRG